MPDASPVLCLSGWAQPADALQRLAPYGYHIAYGDAPDMETVFARLSPYRDVPLAIGWSLGGWLLMQAASAGIIRPQRLVLLASPAQFVACEQFPHGMGAETFSLFQQNYLAQPERTARRFAYLIAHGDKYQQAVTHLLQQQQPESQPHHHWQPWLAHLAGTRHDRLSLNNLPETLLIYGEADRIVAPQQGAYLQEHLPASQLLRLPECGHAPHLHNAPRTREIIHEATGHALN